MPIHEADPWRRQYFERVACPQDVSITAEDTDAWAWHQDHRWVYDKITIALSQGLAAGPHGTAPPGFPVFSKPAINLKGMGIGSRVIHSAEEYEQRRTPGHMWMTLLEGRHVSSDIAVVAGEPRWWRHAAAVPAGDGMFDYWHVHAAPEPGIEAWCGAWLRTHLATYTGMLNVETIAERIIEVHLRFADQWPDLYGGDAWVEAVVRLYRDRQWTFTDGARRDGYSVALFGPHGRDFRHPPRELIDHVSQTPGASSLQIAFREDMPREQHTMPPGGFRLAVINCWDLEAGRTARATLAAHFKLD
jgi:hypothetical protein